MGAPFADRFDGSNPDGQCQRATPAVLNRKKESPMNRATALCIALAIASGMALAGCQGGNSRQNDNQSSNSPSAQVGTGEDLGTSGVSSDGESPSTQPSKP
jgi:hypothetical protein